ncbi:hypothetical protein J6590_012086 [Homalodisca vitripennis]|nr:hypothetical protein J6590_012086 [Homalodisca vitripennis]
MTLCLRTVQREQKRSQQHCKLFGTHYNNGRGVGEEERRCPLDASDVEVKMRQKRPLSTRDSWCVLSWQSQSGKDSWDRTR